MATTKPADDSPAADAPTTELAEAAPTAPTEHVQTEAPERLVAPVVPKRGRKIALVATGAVVAAALLFGGGVAVGIAIPTGGPGFSQQGGPGGFPGGEQGGQQSGPQRGGQQGGTQGDGTGQRPTMPGQGNGTAPGQGGTDDSSTDTEEG